MKKPLTISDMARMGGKARARKMTKAQRRASARKAGLANAKQWSKKRKRK